MSDTGGQRTAREQKLSRLKELGRDPYSIERFDRSHAILAVLDHFDSLGGLEVTVAGRVMSLRAMGKVLFADLMDASGRIQLYLRQADLPNDWALAELMDIGDIVGVRGEVFRTRTGEKSVHVREAHILAKCLEVLPVGKEREGEHYAELRDREQRYRHRHLDMLANPEALETLLTRSRIISETRRFLDGEGFLEVETPVLQYEAGGAAARPFATHHNALGVDLKLRISLELYLKRLMIGGIEKVYEIGRVFRNEGLSTRHLPEFTLLELYQAYVNLEDIMELVERMFLHLAETCFGRPVIEVAGHELDFGKPWSRLSLPEVIERETGVKPAAFDTLESAKAAGEALGLDTSEEVIPGGIMEKIMERFVQPKLIEPAFLTDYPLDTSPFAKKVPGNPRLVRRFEGYVAGQELANAFSELNDPLDQRERLMVQSKQREAGDEEAHPLDEEFLFAMDCAMPPAGGLGIGMDRLAVVLTGAGSIRDVVFFPTLRPEHD